MSSKNDEFKGEVIFNLMLKYRSEEQIMGFVKSIFMAAMGRNRLVVLDIIANEMLELIKMQDNEANELFAWRMENGIKYTDE